MNNRYIYNSLLFSGISIGTYCLVKTLYKKNINDKKEKLSFISNQKFYSDIGQYIFIKYQDKINNFTYQEENIYTFNEYRYRRKEKPTSMKVLFPVDCNFNIQYNNSEININIEMLNDHNNDIIKLIECDHCSSEEHFVQKIELTCDNKESLINFVDEAREYMKNEYEKYKKASNETMCVYYYKKDYWILLAKSPKRPIDTLYLKEGVRENLVSYVETFFSKETRDTYLSFGIPYKSVNMIYGPPGSGKTSTIKGIASVLDCDIYILPISKDMLDHDLVGAFTYINEKEDKQRIIVIEDIDTLFDDRKKGDKDNGITLQAFLNCLDGFTCIEGTMLFLTANKPEILDYALLRSCRIDNKIELGYADKHQTKEIFEKILPDQKESFNEFYKSINHKEFTIAMLQEFLFYNRNCKDILEIKEKFIKIVEKNDPKNFEIVKDENKNFYS